VSKLDFHFEFHSEIPHLDNALRLKAESRLQALAEDHSDMIGASVAVTELSQEETPHAFQSRVVAYIRPENLAAVETGDTIDLTLENAIDAIERQVHERREKFHKPWQQTDKTNPKGVYELSTRELFDAYGAQEEPAKLLERDRNDIAAELMGDYGLDQEAAYYAVDQMLVFAQELLETESATG